ncbi:hypothetical protein F6W79_14590 [Vibrio diabolicus]|uniref:hypothetical protein n=1 Tax=Vibrio diabolicus TaxID=50719 RepID=UPI0012456B1A|nr:hypothetical protein [Vibrio diabolicus]KAB0316294.1 hypothetical protein F6W79_14590 [Vibrio diabolicus]
MDLHITQIFKYQVQMFLLNTLVLILTATQAGIDKDDYNEKIAQKIELHKHIGTRLVDTYHYNWCDGELEQKLQDKLASEGIYPNPISTQKVIEAIEQQDFIKNAVAELKKNSCFGSRGRH